MIGEHRLDWHGFGQQAPYDPLVHCPECLDDCFKDELEEYGMCPTCWDRWTGEYEPPDTLEENMY